MKEVNEYGASRLIYTDINRDGMKQSPNFEETIKVAEISNCPVIISGGVHDMNDISFTPYAAQEMNELEPNLSKKFEKIGFKFDAGI